MDSGATTNINRPVNRATEAAATASQPVGPHLELPDGYIENAIRATIPRMKGGPNSHTDFETRPLTRSSLQNVGEQVVLSNNPTPVELETSATPRLDQVAAPQSRYATNPKISRYELIAFLAPELRDAAEAAQAEEEVLAATQGEAPHA